MRALKKWGTRKHFRRIEIDLTPDDSFEFGRRDFVYSRRKQILENKWKLTGDAAEMAGLSVGYLLVYFVISANIRIDLFKIARCKQSEKSCALVD